MSLHSKWVDGDLIFYDGTQDIMKVPKEGNVFEFGESGEGIDVKFYGDTIGNYVLYDESADELVIVRTDRGVALTSFTDASKTKYDVNTAITTGDTSITASYAHTTIAADVTISGGMSAIWGSATLNTLKTFDCSAGAGDLAGGHFSVDMPSGAILAANSWAAGISVGGNLGGTLTGNVAAFRVRTPSAGEWDYLFDIPAALADGAATTGTAKYIDVSIAGTLYRILATST